MKLLWMSDSPLLATGFGRVTREITRRLAQVPGLEVACLGWGYDGWPHNHEEFPVTIYPARSRAFGQDSFERVIHEFKPDVVITLAELWMIEWIHAHALRPRFKWIGYFPLDGGPFYPPWERVLKDVDEVVAMSTFGQRVFQEGVPSKRIHVIYHGVDTAVFRPLAERPALKAQERFKDKFVIGCVARNQPRKNVPALVKAVAMLAPRLDRLHLYLHMDPCDVGYDMVTLLHRYRLEGRADVSDPSFCLNVGLDDAQLNRLYNLFDIMVLPSTGEGFGLPILESLAAGIPVVATDYSACTELVRGRGELARVLTTVTTGANLIEQAIVDVDDLGACIEKLYGDPKLTREYGAAAREFAEGLAWDKLIPQWLEVIRLATGADVPGRTASEPHPA
jgi:glycosyltransferase involved in cell wall biosynthesis